jgi:hypothetical protein
VELDEKGAGLGIRDGMSVADTARVVPSLNMMIGGGPAQDLRNFQVASTPILSVLTCSTSLPHDILKVSEKTDHDLPGGRVKRDDGVPDGNSYWFLVGF